MGDILIGRKPKEGKTKILGPWQLNDYVTNGRIIVRMGEVYDYEVAKEFADRVGLVLPIFNYAL